MINIEKYQGIDDIQRDKILKEFENLKELEENYFESTRKYKMGSKFARYLLSLNVIIFAIALVFGICDIYFPYQMEIVVISSNSLLFIFSLWFLVELYSSTKCSKLELKNHDLIFLETYRAIINLDKYVNNIGLDAYKKLAMENIEKIIKLVSNWDYGNLKITKTLIGNRIDSLKESIINKPLGYINDDKIRVISHLINTFSEFLIYLLNPSIEQIDKINSMFELYLHSEYEIPSKLDDIRNYLYNKPKVARTSFGIVVMAAIYIFWIFILKFEIRDAFAIMVVAFFSAVSSAHHFISIKRTNSNKF